MQIEPFETDDGYRCWLSEREQDLLVDYYSDDLEKQLAIELLLDGLRSEEVPRVCKEDFRRLDVDEEAYKLRIWQSKRGFRECPSVPSDNEITRGLGFKRGRTPSLTPNLTVICGDGHDGI